MKHFKISVLLFHILFKLTAQDTLEIDSQHPENYDIPIKIISVNQRHGIANDTGKVLMKPQFENISFFSKDTACTLWKGIIKARHAGNYALVAPSGKPLTPLQFDDILFLPATCQATNQAGLVACIKKFGRYGLINTKGDILIRPSYHKIDLLTDHDGKLTVPEVVRVRRKNLFGMMDLRSRKIVKTEYNGISFFQVLMKKERKKETQITILLLNKKGKMGIKNLHYHTQSALVYDEIHPYDSVTYMARVKKGRKYGFINLVGELKISTNFDQAQDFRGGVAIVKKRNKFGVIKSSGKSVLPFHFTMAQYVNAHPQKDPTKELILVTKNKSFGVVDVEGKILIPIQYEELRYSLERQNFEGKKNGKTVFFKI